MGERETQWEHDMKQDEASGMETLKMAGRTLAGVVVGTVAAPIAALGAGVVYVSERVNGKNDEEASKEASDAFDDAMEGAFKFGYNHAGTVAGSGAKLMWQAHTGTDLPGAGSSDYLPSNLDAPQVPDVQVPDVADHTVTAGDVHFGNYHTPDGHPLTTPDVNGTSWDHDGNRFHVSGGTYEGQPDPSN